MKIVQTMPGIRSRRRMKGLSVQEAADALGVTRQAWYLWEKGAAMPNAAYSPAIVEILGCAIEDLYEDTGEGSDDGEAAEQD